MKWIKKYDFFIESFDIKDEDDADVKQSKELMNLAEEHLKEYQSKKSQIDTLYNSAKSLEELRKEGFGEEQLKQIIGDGDKENPFLIEYATIARMKKEVDLLQIATANDKILKDDFNREITLTKGDDETIARIKGKVTDISNRIAGRNKEILDLAKKFPTLQKNFLQKMTAKKKEMDDYIKKISDSDQK